MTAVLLGQSCGRKLLKFGPVADVEHSESNQHDCCEEDTAHIPVVDTRGERLTTFESSVEVRTWLPPRVPAPEKRGQSRIASSATALCVPTLLRGCCPLSACG